MLEIADRAYGDVEAVDAVDNRALWAHVVCGIEESGGWAVPGFNVQVWEAIMKDRTSIGIASDCQGHLQSEHSVDGGKTPSEVNNRPAPIGSKIGQTDHKIIHKLLRNMEECSGVIKVHSLINQHIPPRSFNISSIKNYHTKMQSAQFIIYSEINCDGIGLVC